MSGRKRGRLSIVLVAAVTASLTLSAQTAALGAGPGGGGGGGGGGGESESGSLYSELVVALRAEDGTPILTEYAMTGEEGSTLDYCVQPVSYKAVPGITATVNPLDGRNVWVLPLQGAWIENPVDPLPVAEIEPCDVQPQYAMFVAEPELERLNLTRTSDDVLARKIQDVRTKLISAAEVSLDPAGRLSTDGSALDASPEYAAIYQSLMTTGAVPGLDFADIPYDAFQLGAVAIGTAASKYNPITVDTVQYYNRSVGFTTLDPLPSWGTLNFIQSADPDPTTPMPIDVLPAGENFVDYSGFTYNRADTFVGATTWLDVPKMTWRVDRILDVVDWTNLRSTAGLTEDEVNNRTLTGVTAFAQMADDARAVIVYLHENEVVLPGFYMDPVLVDTYAEQLDSITNPAVQLTAPAIAFQTLPFVATGSLFNPWGGTLIDEARVRVVVDAPGALDVGDVTVSSGGVEVPFTVAGGDLTGWWGPDTGFEMDKGYRMATDFDVTVTGDAPSGDYTVTLELVDIDDTTAVLATDRSVIDVRPAALAVLWGGDLPVLGTQGSYYPLPVRVYSPTEQEGTLTFTLTGPGDDPGTDLLEELAAGDAKIYASNGLDMVAFPLALTGQDELSGNWKAALGAGYNDLVWYLMVNEGAPVGQYGLDVGIAGGTDLAEAAYVSFAAPPVHGQRPPDTGDDTTAPVVTIKIDGLGTDTASFSFVANEDGVTFQTLLAVDGVKGDWEDASAGTKTYKGLKPGAYVLYVKATDSAGNTATYLKKFTIPEPEVVTPPTTTPTPTPEPGVVTPPAKGQPTTKVVTGPRNESWVLDDEISFTVASDAEDATYEVSLNGRRWTEQTTATFMVKGLRPGLNRIRVRARVQGDVDATPVRRTVWMPYGVRKLTRTDGWKLMRHENAFLDTFAMGRKGQFMARFAPKVKRIALVVTTAKGSGRVHVYLGSRRITRKAISLRSGETQRSQLVMVRRFAKAQRGQVRVVAVGGGAVRVEGIGLAN